MKIQNLRKKTEGFTIIEVLIVLAIAGLILLIVFLAVPALQRNSRNTSYRTEAGQILSAANEWSTNNSGAVPTSTNSAAIMGLTKTKNITGLTIEGSGSTTAPAFNTAVLRTGAKCGAVSGSTFTTTSGPSRAIALVYAVEAADGSITPQCTES